MQKVVTLFLDISGYEGRGGFRLSNADLHGRVDEHLVEYLEQGWRVETLQTLKGPDGGGWLVVLLEKPDQ